MVTLPLAAVRTRMAGTAAQVVTHPSGAPRAPTPRLLPTVRFLFPKRILSCPPVQFRDLSEQLYRGMDNLVNQPTQHAILKVLTAATRAIRVPDVPDLFIPRSSRLRAYKSHVTPPCLSASRRPRPTGSSRSAPSSFTTKRANLPRRLRPTYTQPRP